jgi:REP element-mobilizing transposase RayT
MARKPRIHFEGAIYHVIARGNGGQKLFHDLEDHFYFIEILKKLKEGGLKFYAYCLMPNHFHLLVQVGAIPLAVYMQAALTRYAMHFNLKRRTYGHVFQGRYKEFLVQKDGYFLALVNYIHANPVRAGLVDSPEKWKWSGHCGLNGLVEDPLVDALPGYRTQAAAASYGQGELFPLLVDPAEITLGPLAAYASEFAKNSGCSVDALESGSRTRTVVRVRHAFIVAALAKGYRRKDVALFAGCSEAALDKVLRRKGHYSAKRPLASDLTFGSDDVFE